MRVLRMEGVTNICYYSNNAQWYRHLRMAISGFRPRDLDRGMPRCCRGWLASRDCHLPCVTGLGDFNLLTMVGVNRDAGKIRWPCGAMCHRGSGFVPAR